MHICCKIAVVPNHFRGCATFILRAIRFFKCARPKSKSFIVMGLSKHIFAHCFGHVDPRIDSHCTGWAPSKPATCGGLGVKVLVIHASSTWSGFQQVQEVALVRTCCLSSLRSLAGLAQLSFLLCYKLYLLAPETHEFIVYVPTELPGPEGFWNVLGSAFWGPRVFASSAYWFCVEVQAIQAKTIKGPKKSKEKISASFFGIVFFVLGWGIAPGSMVQCDEPLQKDVWSCGARTALAMRECAKRLSNGQSLPLKLPSGFFLKPGPAKVTGVPPTDSHANVAIEAAHAECSWPKSVPEALCCVQHLPRWHFDHEKGRSKIACLRRVASLLSPMQSPATQVRVSEKVFPPARVKGMNLGEQKSYWNFLTHQLAQARQNSFFSGARAARYAGWLAATQSLSESVTWQSLFPWVLMAEVGLRSLSYSE